MFKIERKIVEFVERNVNILFMLAITGLAIAVRYAGRDFVSGDMTWFLLGWFQKIADNGGIHSLKNQVGDYNILYQTIVALFTYIGDKSIYYYKILSIFFDFCMAISAAIFACELSKKEKNDKVFFSFLLQLLCCRPLFLILLTGDNAILFIRPLSFLHYCICIRENITVHLFF